MVTLSLLQAAATPAWVGPTMAISLAVIALSVLGMAIVVGRSVLRLVAHRKRIAAVFDTLQEDAQQALVAARRLPEGVYDVIRTVRTAHPMDVLRTGVSALSAFDPETADKSPAATLRKGVRLTAQVPMIVAAHEHIRNGREPVAV